MIDKKFQNLCEELTAALTDGGLLIHGGFAGFQAAVIDDAAPPEQVAQMRLAFYAGATHVFFSVMNVLDHECEEPTEKDLARMDAVAKELERFAYSFQAAATDTAGSA